MRAMSTARLLELRLKARDLRVTMAFYTDHLGFALRSSWGPDDAPEGCILDHGSARLQFYAAAPDETPGATGVIVIQTAGVLDLHRTLGEDVRILWGPEVYGYGMRELAVRDPDGYVLAFCEPVEG
jgi:catechol 2,3-dioxygenase-like lactoylglutathione lyase family enzyme